MVGKFRLLLTHIFLAHMMRPIADYPQRIRPFAYFPKTCFLKYICVIGFQDSIDLPASGQLQAQNVSGRYSLRSACAFL